MDERVHILSEPELEFGYQERLHDPHDGLALFGPSDSKTSSQPRSITYGVIGTDAGVEAFRKWVEVINKPVISQETLKNPRLWPPFPGFEATFHSILPISPARIQALDYSTLLIAANNRDPHKRAGELVKMYLNGIELAKKRDDIFNLLVCVVPDYVWRNCRPLSRVSNGIGQRISADERRARASGQLDWIEQYNPIEYSMSVDFRRQIKARSMRFDAPLQLVRESIINPPGLSTARLNLSPISDRAWNLCTAIYYKGGGKPWRLATAREGVCYIGMAFRRTNPNLQNATACCAAQMFLDSGDGIVFLGEYGPWYSEEKRECHLSRKAAKDLLEGILKTYSKLDGRELTEVFLHYRSSINDEEISGYRDALPRGVRLVGIRVRLERHGIRLFRAGTRPVMRGTVWILNDRTAFLWGSGFKPRLGTYDGWEVPIPLRIDIQYGDADILQVAKDILGLTKLNYNACRLGESEPVTIGFSDAVGEILVSNPTVTDRRPNFKYYI